MGTEVCGSGRVRGYEEDAKEISGEKADEIRDGCKGRDSLRGQW